jgi:4-methyl-5(b-hydroxyethyl)-thiazole monophosphate biosynthesis
MKKTVVFIADGSEEIETLTPVDYLRRAGVDLKIVSVGNKTVRCAHNVVVTADETLDALDTGDLPDAVVVPGGMPGSRNIAESKAAVDFIRRMNDSGKLVCAICAAPALVLPATGALEGRKWTCYPGMKDNAKSYAANHTDGVPFVHDGNLITGRGPGAAEQFSMEIVKTLAGEKTADEIKRGSVQR